MSIEKHLAAYKAHTEKSDKGDHIVYLSRSYRHIFIGEGWNNPIRERLVNGVWRALS